ncbi:MAG: sigma-70 family RNA polymerase sigma factor [Lachnospiraceae bacterium]|nr:sigma-70 family RNA polymerase sigma factor [Lachnospiraceae bacterium]MCM1239031.1 sigma-70 family RNA polymerase sigma factor [Lachnospiraceae bacterium]
MKSEIPLTPEQRLFAAEYHDLVEKFLCKKNLPRDEYYDVIIFGFLRAVYRFCTTPELQKYSFTTIAWKGMEGELLNYNRTQRSQKRHAYVFSLNEALCEDGLPLEETIASPDHLMRQLEEQLLLHELAKRVSEQQMKIVRMKSYGYNNRDIARSQNTTMKRIRELLEDVRTVLAEICYE